MRPNLSMLKYELHDELENILNYWENNTLDLEYGGFYGRIDHKNRVVEKASKGAILNTRILWSFSAASNYLKTDRYAKTTGRAYQYLIDHFIDKKYGGIYWDLDYSGKPVNTRKQVYAQAFGIYAFSEYYQHTQLAAAKDQAIALFELIEKHARDQKKGGFLEAFGEDWSELEDMRLSEKDMNVAKTMNTHLHILEAYTSLYRIYKDPQLEQSLQALIELFLNTFYNQKNHHYHLFFDTDWQLKSQTISYGHDIETAWLVMEAAQEISNKALMEQASHTAIEVIDTFLSEALDADNAVINEKDLNTGHIDKDRHWWPQVEAMIGLSFAYRMTWKQKYTRHATDIWSFVKDHLLDTTYGEWHFRVDPQGKVYTEEDKVSMWKAPYHTVRACIMINKL